MMAAKEIDEGVGVSSRMAAVRQTLCRDDGRRLNVSSLWAYEALGKHRWSCAKIKSNPVTGHKLQPVRDESSVTARYVDT
uniref:Uncharacterized protein n=1 Tax=Oryza nivara TaxID=4536 RepID=A0A0E0FIG3_ORYNI